MGGGKKAVKKEEHDAAPAVPVEILAQLHPLERKALPHLKNGMLASELAKAAGMQEVEVARAIQWLENKGAIQTEPIIKSELLLGENGAKALEHGLPEQRFLTALNREFHSRKDILKEAKLNDEEFGASIGVLKQEGALKIEGEKYIPTEKGKKETIGNDVIAFLQKVKRGLKEETGTLPAQEQKLLIQLRKRRGYIISKETKDQRISLTDLGEQLVKTDLSKYDFADALTREDLEKGTWQGKTYRSFDVTAPVPKAHGGKEHFVTEAIDDVRKIWIEMGFTEMEGDLTQTAFWDLDALFVPQDHPAREVQDTFYLGKPVAGDIARDVFERVRDVHENGASTGSTGWRMKFSRQESEQFLLRTHTTVLSAQTLWKIRSKQAIMPGKYFTVGKVFRNEKLDWKHLFEFHQVEGIVVDPDATFSQLIGYLRVFFAKMGFPKIRLRPHHFPYTEPSVEVDVWHPVRNQWIELGGAGVFRPEVAKTLTGEDIPVLAWGLGLERIIVDKFGFTDLRDLYRNDLAQLRDTPSFVRKEAPRG